MHCEWSVSNIGVKWNANKDDREAVPVAIISFNAITRNAFFKPLPLPPGPLDPWTHLYK